MEYWTWSERIIVIMKRLLFIVLMWSGTACAIDSSVAPMSINKSTPTITITFDDAYEGVYQYAYPILREYNIPANVAVFTDIWTDSLNWPGRLTIEQAKKMHSDGWSMVSHSASHSNLLLLNAGELYRELYNSKRILDSLQFRGSNVFIVPFLLWNDNILSEISSIYTMARCCTESWYSIDTLSSLPIDTSDMNWYTLTGIDISNYKDTLLYDQTYNFSTEEGRYNISMTLTDVIEHNKFIDIVIHDMTAEDSSEFRKLIQLINRSDIRSHVITYDRILK